MTLTEIRPHIESAWGLNTTYTPERWTPINASCGQCAITSVYLVRRFGGQLRKGWVSDSGRAPVRHYWCVIGGKVVDWTWLQFNDPAFRYCGTSVARRFATEAELIADPWMQERYDTFAARVDRAVAEAKAIA